MHILVILLASTDRMLYPVFAPNCKQRTPFFALPLALQPFPTHVTRNWVTWIHPQMIANPVWSGSKPHCKLVQNRFKIDLIGSDWSVVGTNPVQSGLNPYWNWITSLCRRAFWHTLYVCVQSTYCTYMYSCDMCSENEDQQSSGYTLSKCLVSNPGLLLLFALWMMLTGERSLFVLEIMYYMLSGLSYRGISFYKKMDKLRFFYSPVSYLGGDFCTCWESNYK